MIPALLEDVPDALVILDWSGWTNAAWFSRGPEGMAKRVAGDLLELIAAPAPPRLVLAVDTDQPTHRHAMTEPLDAPKRYKAHRPKKPFDFHAIADRLQQLAVALRIPILYPADFEPQAWEADDAAATATVRARAAGLPVVLHSRDKDWRQLVTDEAPRVTWWSPADELVLDRAGVIEKHGVPPELLGDWLALVGDTSDNVPGAQGIGDEKATALVKAWRTVESMLAQMPMPESAIADMGKAIDRMRRERDKARKDFADTTEIEKKIEEAASARDLWKWLGVVHAQREAVELSRRLVELRRDVPIELDLDEAIVGGWNVGEVRDVLRDLGVGRLGRDLAPRQKRLRGRKNVSAPRAQEGKDHARENGRDYGTGGASPAHVGGIGDGAASGDRGVEELRRDPGRGASGGAGDEPAPAARVGGAEAAGAERAEAAEQGDRALTGLPPHLPTFEDVQRAAAAESAPTFRAWLDEADLDEPRCGAKAGALTCARPRGHEGPHVDDTVGGSWRDGDVHRSKGAA